MRIEARLQANGSRDRGEETTRSGYQTAEHHCENQQKQDRQKLSLVLEIDLLVAREALCVAARQCPALHMRQFGVYKKHEYEKAEDYYEEATHLFMGQHGGYFTTSSWAVMLDRSAGRDLLTKL